jgi:large repetitive protein
MGGKSGSEFTGRRSTVQFKLFRALSIAFLVLVLGAGLRLVPSGESFSLSLSPAIADDVEYVYDELGRLVQASNYTSGQAVLYNYDAVGNINSQTAVPLGTLSIGYFSPNHGPAGTVVTISGTGFGTTPGANTVKFNGTVAVVSAATQTQLVVSVPAAATTGSISVQVGANTVTSSTGFTVTAHSDGPVITGLFPPLGVVGQIVTVAGSGFEPVAVQDRVRFNTALGQVTSSTPDTIATSVPPGAGSGKVFVTTPRGMAVSPMDFIVVPSGYSATNVGSTGRIPVDGSSTSISLPAARSVSVQLFDGNAGDLLTIGVTSTSLASCTIKVFNPDGTPLTVAAGVIVTAAGQGVQLPKLPATGTYTVVADPGSNTGSIALSIVKPLQLSLVLGDPPVTVPLAPPGRRALLSFAGTAGAYANFSLSTTTVSAGTVSIFAPDGGLLDSRSFTSPGATLQPQLPVDGTYTVLIDPTGALGGTVSAAVSMASTPTLGVNQGSFDLNLVNTTPATLTFQGSTGQYLALAVIEGGGGISGASIRVAGPDGVQLTTGTLTTKSCNGIGCPGQFSGSTVVNMGPLPVGGTYSVTIQETSAGSGTLSLVLSSALAGTLATGTPYNATLAQIAQPMLLTFAGVAGDYPAVAFTEDNGQISGANITIFRPDGTLLGTGSFTATLCTGFGCPTGYKGQSVVNTGPLPASGNYTVLVQQTGAVGTTGLTITQSTPLTDTLTTAVPVNEQTTLPGQPIQVSFSGTAGKYLGLSLSESSGLIPGATIRVFSPDGSLMAAGVFNPTLCLGLPCSSATYSGAGLVNMGPLPADGIYTALIQQVGATGTGTLTLTLSTPLTQTLVPNTPQSDSTSLPGQPLQLSFAGTTGQYFGLALSEGNGAALPSGGLIPGATITVLKPDGTQLTTGTFTATLCAGFGCDSTYSGVGLVNIGPLPANGTYTVLIQQTNAPGTGTLTVTLSAPLTGALPVGVASDEQTALLGQPMQLTFNGAPGAYIALAVAESAGQIPGARIFILAPDGSPVTNATFSPTLCTGTGCNNTYTGNTLLNVGPLTQTGQYAVLVQQTAALGTADLVMSLSAPASSALAPGTATDVQTSLLGQALAGTFTGTAGSYVSLTVAETASPISGASVKVINPDGTPLAMGTLSPSLCSGCTATFTGSVNLFPQALPQTGTYTVIAQQKTAANGKLTFTANGIQQPAQTNFNLSTSTPGAAATFNFSASAGQSLSIGLTNIVLSPASPTSLSLLVTRPDNSAQFSTTCTVSATGCEIALWNLAVSGTYTVKVTPGSSQTLTANAVLTPAFVGVLTPGTPMSLNLASPGQMAVLDFTRTAGSIQALNFSSLTTSPANVSMIYSVYNSSAVQVLGPTSSTGFTQNLTTLPADTYTLVLSPASAVSSTSQVVLQPGVTGTVPTDGTSSTYAATVPGQNMYLSFQASAGQSLSVALSNVIRVPGTGSSQFTVNILNPDGSGVSTNVGSICDATSGCSFPLLKLTQTGTYSIAIFPQTADKMTATLRITPMVTGALVTGSPFNLSLGQPGQSAALTFTAAEGQAFALGIASMTTVPASRSYSVQIRNSAGQNVLDKSASSDQTFATNPLPAGTYTLYIWTGGLYTANMQITLQPAITGTVAVDGNAAAVATNLPGQIATTTFFAAAGQNLSLILTNTFVTPASPRTDFAVTVIRPDGNKMLDQSCTVSRGCSFALSRLTLTGTYTFVLSSPASQVAGATVQILSDVSTVLKPGSPFNLSVTTPGQAAALSFTASAGQTFALNFSSVSTPPAGTTYSVQLLGTTGNPVSIPGSVSADTTINIPNLAADTYTLFITSGIPITASMQVTLLNGVTGVLTADGAPSSYAAVAAGQNIYLTFQGTAGQTPSVTLTNVSQTPPTPRTVFGFRVDRPDGFNFINSQTGCDVTPGSCAFNLSRLPQTGTYLITLGSQATQKEAATVQLLSDATGSLTLGTPYNLVLSAPGQNAALTFTATAGQTAALTISSMVSSPANTSYSFLVLNATGGIVNSGSTSSGTNLSLNNLAAGTYTVFVWPNIAATTSMQVTYH